MHDRHPGPHSSVAHLAAHTQNAKKAAQPGYRAPQVCQIIGITYRQIDYWARTDLVRPSLAVAHGSGTQRRYSRTDLIELAVIKRLLDAGISLQAVRRAIHHLNTPGGGDLTTASLVLHGDATLIARHGHEITELIQAGHGVLNIVPLGGVTDDIDQALDRLDPAHQRTMETT
jgi:DNA-binding transcriptional MerR regulator